MLINTVLDIKLLNKSDSDKLDNVLLIIGFVGIAIVILYAVHVFGPIPLLSENIFPQEIHIQRHVVRELSVNKTELFNVMADVENYPAFFPDTYVSVDMINKTDNVFYTKEVITYDKITKPLIVKHVIYPYDKQVTQVLGGVAKGTVITTTFESTNTGTKVTVDLVVHIKGILISPGMAPKNGFEGATNSFLQSFEAIVMSNKSPM